MKVTPTFFFYTIWNIGITPTKTDRQPTKGKASKPRMISKPAHVIPQQVRMFLGLYAAIYPALLKFCYFWIFFVGLEFDSFQKICMI